MRITTTKALSSPGRTDKFPPPLMRFLRSNVGSKSRGGRSRKSPIFFRRKNTTIEATTQEPSSPKVTCMGQVRVKRSKQRQQQSSSSSKNKHSTRTPSKGQYCKCIQNARFCCLFNCTCKTKSFMPFWKKWRIWFHVGSERKVQTRVDSSRFESKCGSKSEACEQEYSEREEEDDESEHETKISASSCSPPKNALLLMRSRSAPYRPSSLANQFWGSPKEPQSTEDREVKEEYIEISKSGKESVSKDCDLENEKKLELLEFSVQERFVKSANIDELRTGDDDLSNLLRPLILTRCKSEPARKTITTTTTTTGKLVDSEMVLWKKRRLDFADSSSFHDL